LASKVDVIGYGLAAQILAFALAFTHNTEVWNEISIMCTEELIHEVGLRMRGLVSKDTLKRSNVYIQNPIFALKIFQPRPNITKNSSNHSPPTHPSTAISFRIFYTQFHALVYALVFNFGIYYASALICSYISSPTPNCEMKCLNCSILY
jgi:hypothetical protein